MLRKICYVLFLSLFWLTSYATHNRAGDITFRQIDQLTYEFTITIFADATSRVVDNRPGISINWGDNTPNDSLTEISRVQYDLPNNPQFVKRTWVGTHTFPGGGATYTIKVEDRNRNAGIDNISNSVNVPFTIQTTLTISPFGGTVNNSPLLLNDPIDIACVGEVFIYNPGAYDPDGDSLAYSIGQSLGLSGRVAPGYQQPPASNFISVDPLTGNLIWDSPTVNGQYNVVILIKEYRRGILLSTILRDIQVDVLGFCQNDPPFIISEERYCVEAGENIIIPILGDDPNIADLVELSASSEIFENGFLNPASRSDFNIEDDPVTASIGWSTRCENVRINPYNVSIRAVDNVVQNPLSTYKSIKVVVIAPAPENVTISSIETAIQLNWDNTQCQNAVGYKVYRRLDSSGFTPDSCIIGVPSNIGYSEIATIRGLNNTSYLDNEKGAGLVPGQKYCYLITKFFSDGAESYASEEVCAVVGKLVPVITNVSISSTDLASGTIELEWSPPDNFNQQSFPPPYRYLVYQLNQGTPTLLDSTNSLQDTVFSVSGLNTVDQDFEYRIDLYSYGNGKILAGFSAIASSIFLRIEATDNVLKLNWEESVPWLNSEYTIFRKSGSSAPSFDSLTTVSEQFYNDSNLANGTEYCYYIHSTGFYGLSSVKSPLINLSQEVCSSPIDNIGPCAPEFEISANCEKDSLRINWNNPNTSCPEKDIVKYRIYKSNSESITPELIDSTETQFDTTLLFENDEVAGCYSVTSVDSVGNESKVETILCSDFCPFYELPNIFTPNGDGFNDRFVPLKGYRYVDSVELVVFNRWGESVFSTTDPAINWTGVHDESNELVSDGVYFFTCKVFEQSVTALEPRIINGNITVLDSKTTSPPR